MFGLSGQKTLEFAFPVFVLNVFRTIIHKSENQLGLDTSLVLKASQPAGWMVWLMLCQRATNSMFALTLDSQTPMLLPNEVTMSNQVSGQPDFH